MPDRAEPKTDNGLDLSTVGAWVPFPSVFLDEVMPSLGDTEWRLLCVIVRQTLGWQQEPGAHSGRRKQRDWMSQKQLITRTGRSSAALSAALDALVRKKLVECSDKRGEPLSTSAQRRRHRGRVYFSLPAHLWKKPEGSSGSTSSPALCSIPSSQTPLHKAKRTKENEHKEEKIQIEGESRDFIRRYEGWTKVSQIAASRYRSSLTPD